MSTRKAQPPVAQGTLIAHGFMLLTEGQPLLKVAEYPVFLYVLNAVCFYVPDRSPFRYIILPAKHPRRIIKRGDVVAFSPRPFRLCHACPPLTFGNNFCLVIVPHNLSAMRTFVANCIKARTEVFVIFPDDATHLLALVVLVPDCPFKFLHGPAKFAGHIKIFLGACQKKRMNQRAAFILWR